MAAPRRVVMWFRRDLRLTDNPALVAAAAEAEEVVGLFVVDDALWGSSGAPRRAFLAGCLGALDASTGGHLVIRHGRPEEVVPAVAAEASAAGVFAAEDFAPYGRARDDRVAAALASLGVAWRPTGSNYAVAPGSVLNRQAAPYKVFTPFSRAWADHGWARPQNQPPRLRWAAMAGEPVPDPGTTTVTLPAPGEEAARAAARRFWNDGLDRYDVDRNVPAGPTTSRLSPYLRWGCIHPRQLLARLGTSRAHSVFRSELCWREFYAEVLWHDPGSARRAWNPAMRSMDVDFGPATDEAFAAWAQGQTGYPLVDAGMRQLAAEAWVHNRVRMITASFLVKDLHLDWRRGARYFLDHLVDGDLASNHHGWQWVAGTGTDASPYVRVFNPITQSRRFDPQGTYIRRWVPELAGLGPEHVHEPWTAPGGPPPSYPRPIVDHGEERIEALRRYEACRASGTGDR